MLDNYIYVWYHNKAIKNALVAQLDRVFGYEPKGRGFESLRAHQIGARKLVPIFLFFTLTISIE